jgi:hypothetical protein
MAGTVGTGEISLNIYQGARSRLVNPSTLSLEEQREYLLDVKKAQEAFRKQRVIPYGADKRRAHTTQTKTVNEFYELLKKVFDAATVIDGTEYPITITKEYPPIDAKLPVFSLKLLDRRPWSFRGKREMGPRQIEEVPDPQFPGSNLRIHQRRQINEIQLVCWARTSKVADDLANWVEDKFFEYLWALQWGGVAHPVEWLGRDQDKYLVERQQQMYGAVVRFSVVTSKITYERVSILRKLTHLFGIATEL